MATLVSLDAKIISGKTIKNQNSNLLPMIVPSNFIRKIKGNRTIEVNTLNKLGLGVNSDIISDTNIVKYNKASDLLTVTVIRKDNNTAEAGVLNLPISSIVYIAGYSLGTEIMFISQKENTISISVYVIEESIEDLINQIVADAAGGGGGGSYTFENGLNEAAGVVKLGGILTEPATFLAPDNNNLLVIVSEPTETVPQFIFFNNSNQRIIGHSIIDGELDVSKTFIIGSSIQQNKSTGNSLYELTVNKTDEEGNLSTQYITMYLQYNKDNDTIDFKIVAYSESENYEANLSFDTQSAFMDIKPNPAKPYPRDLAAWTGNDGVKRISITNKAELCVRYPNYVDDAAADADNDLPQYAHYVLDSDIRAVRVKP